MKYLIFIVLLISSCSVPSNNIRFSGDHTTEAIRGMWHICYMTHRQVNRSAPELYLWKLCDFPNGFAAIFKDQKMRASLHPGCRHFCMLVADIFCG